MLSGAELAEWDKLHGCKYTAAAAHERGVHGQSDVNGVGDRLRRVRGPAKRTKQSRVGLKRRRHHGVTRSLPSLHPLKINHKTRLFIASHSSLDSTTSASIYPHHLEDIHTA